MKNLQYIFYFVFFTFLFTACKKDHSILGVEVQPSQDALNVVFSDTSKLFCHTVGYDSIISFNDRYKYLGSNQDPHFGRTDVSLILNANILNNQNNISFGIDPQLVSAEIILAVASLDFLGTYTNALTYSVHPLTENLKTTDVHYNNSQVKYNANSVLASHTGTLEIFEGKLVARIPIDFNYANSILLNPQFLTNNATFQSYYKGFYITTSGSNLNPVNQQGFIAKFDLEDALSGFYLHYQNGTPSAVKKNNSYRFVFSGIDAVRYNISKYDKGSIASNILYDQLVSKDTLKGSQGLFLKGMGGTRLKVYIPALQNYAKESSISVNRAELVFHLDPSFQSSGGSYFYPPKFSLLPIDENNYELFALDQASETDLARYNGNYDFTSNKIVFNLSKQFQAIMRGTKKNYGFYLVIADPSPIYTARRDNYIERIILAGTGHATLGPKLNLSYVKLSQGN
ncbi:MAG: DUF4270 family protein [Sphingobacteriaceae bacterium]|nr:DUF4270 family protein [Sphingobacteriaceae bacterium]